MKLAHSSTNERTIPEEAPVIQKTRPEKAFRGGDGRKTDAKSLSFLSARASFPIDAPTNRRDAPPIAARAVVR